MRTDYKYALASPSSNSAKKKLLYWSGIVLIIAAANFGFVHFFLNNPSIVGDGVEGLQIETIDTPRPIAPNQSLESQRFTQDEVEALGYTVPLSTDDAGSELLSAEAIENTALFPDLYLSLIHI